MRNPVEWAAEFVAQDAQKPREVEIPALTRRQAQTLYRLLERAEDSMAADEKREATPKRRRGLDVQEALRYEARALATSLKAALAAQGVN